MKLKHEFEIDPLNPFGNCKLDRKRFAPVLTNMLETFPDGFVMAIDNEWGTGKTTFVKMWQASIAKDYKTIYFNAWENDFDNDVLAALMGELGTLNENSKTETLFKEVVKKGAFISKNILPVLIEAVTNKYIGEGIVNKVAAELAKSTGEIMIEQVTEYANKKKALIEFKNSLGKYIEQTKNGNPIVFIIDELDRCRPDYAVEVLEKVKHFFSVKGIVFVLSINKNELKNAIRGVYNSPNINADDYLRRFIDIEYSIPEPDKKLYCDYLYSYYEFEELPSSNYANKDFLGLAYILFTISNTTLRQQEKIFAYTRIVFGNITSNMLEDLNAVVFALIYIKILFPQFYINFRDKKYKVQEMINEIRSIIPNRFNSETNRTLSWEKCYLVHLYNQYFFSGTPIPKLVDSEGSLLDISFSENKDNEEFSTILNDISQTRRYNRYSNSLETLFKKIDLVNIR